MRSGSFERGAPYGMLLTLLLASLLSGCLGEDPAAPAKAPDPVETDPDVLGPDGRDLRTDLTADDQLPVPVWRVGDWWGIHFYFGSQGGEGRHIDAIVTEAGADGYSLATNDRQAAKIHGLIDYPILGDIARLDLGATAFGGAWDWFAFPMTDGATWSGEIPNIAFDILPPGQVPIDFTATYTSGIEVEGKKVPGYTVNGTTEDGTLIVTYTYAPSVRWMTSATIYDIDPGQDPVEFSMTLMGYGRDWNGTYYENEARVLLDNFDGSGFDDHPAEGGEPFASVSPHVAFTVSSDATYLFGTVFNLAVLGIRETILVPPEGDPRVYQALGAPEDGYGVLLDEPAVAGEWRLVTAGAGGVSASEVFLAELVETSGTL